MELLQTDTGAERQKGREVRERDVLDMRMTVQIWRLRKEFAKQSQSHKAMKD
jgi:hypothetical protein